MRKFFMALGLSLLWLGGSFAEPQEAAAVRASLKGMFEKPETPLIVEPIAVSGAYALADWEQGEMGGRALLRKKDGQWNVLLCAGDEIREAKAMRSAGVPADLAAVLASELARAEGGLPRAKLDKLSSFKGARSHEPRLHPHH
jgi:hypothetical protein